MAVSLRMRKCLVIGYAGVCVILTGCGSGGPQPQQKCSPKTCPEPITNVALNKSCYEAATGLHPDICDPSSDWMKQPAPDVFTAHFYTTVGDIVLTVNRSWAPLSADRFYNLFRARYYDGTVFYRVVKQWAVQWGPSVSPGLAKIYANNGPIDFGVQPCVVDGACFYVDPPKQSNKRGYVAMSSDIKKSTCNSSCQPPPSICTEAKPDNALVAGSELFINLKDNSKQLDDQGFAPFALISEEGMQVVDRLYSGYGELACSGMCHDGDPIVPCNGPHPRRIYTEGISYFLADFPSLSKVITTSWENHAHVLTKLVL